MDDEARVLAGYEADLSTHEPIQRLLALLDRDRRTIAPEVEQKLRRLLGPEQ